MHYQRRLLFLTILDSIIISAAVLLAYLLRFDFSIKPQFLPFMPYVIIMHIIVVVMCLNAAKMYRRMWQYASVGELINLVKATVVAEIILYALNTTVHSFVVELVVPRSIYVLSGSLIILGIGGSRFAWRIFRDNYIRLQPHYRRTLIIGAGQAGVLIAKELKHSPDAEIYPVGFIDDDPAKWNLEVMGLPVFGGRDRIPCLPK